MATDHLSIWQWIGERKACISGFWCHHQSVGHKLVGLCTVFLGILMILSLSGAGGSETDTSAGFTFDNSSEAMPLESLEQSDKLGETIITDQFEIVISSIQSQTAVGLKYNALSAAQGYVYVIVNWQYKSIIPEPGLYTQAPRICLLDGENRPMSADFGATESYASQFGLNRGHFEDLIYGNVVEEAEVYLVDKAQYQEGSWGVQVISETESYVGIAR